MAIITITLTFDDALDSHLDAAIPVLDRYGLKGTFFIHLAAETVGRRAEDWRRAAAEGHELGNHTIFHPAIGSKKWVREGNAIEYYTMDRMQMELEVANNMLQSIDGKTERTFAFPCSNTVLGSPGWPKRMLRKVNLDRTRLMGWINRFDFASGAQEQDYTSVVRKLFFAARCGGLSENGLKRFPLDRYHVPSYQGDGQDTETLLGVVDRAVSENIWTVFSFHGIGGGHGLYCSQYDFEAFIIRLASDSRIRVKTFLDAAKEHRP